jgi:hypothetical protein
VTITPHRHDPFPQFENITEPWFHLHRPPPSPSTAPHRRPPVSRRLQRKSPRCALLSADLLADLCALMTATLYAKLTGAYRRAPAAIALAYLMLMLHSATVAAAAAAEDACDISSSNSDKPKPLSSMLRAALSPAPFARFLVELTDELNVSPSQFTGIFRRLKQVPCRGDTVVGVGIDLLLLLPFAEAFVTMDTQASASQPLAGA